jgi:hypothetical protein
MKLRHEKDIYLTVFGQQVLYTVEYTVPQFGEIKINRLWPAWDFLSKTNASSLTTEQREYIIDALRYRLIADTLIKREETQ